MHAQRWQRIGSLFDELVELDACARAQALARLREEDAELCTEVERLLHGDAAIEGGAHDPVGAPFAALGLDAFSVEVAGMMIGPWRVLREIGRGGMGVVYLAERADGQYEQRAALKLMRVSGDPAGLRRRFLRERQILARLDHPNIARLLDGGVSPAGEPYFALEYIDGEPLLEYVGAQNVDATLRLRLFLEICAAVQFAHRQLVVHCDIKPSNVLVNRDGAVKLLDFGIASVLAADSSSAAETQLRALTPAYASPEQLRGEPITTAADVYALGAVLYEMLTGVRAYRIGATASSLERLAAISDPRRALPSAAVTTLARDDGRAQPPIFASLPVRSLRGDLDVITATALHADAERRYASVEALADDVRRFLAGAPIEARPSSARYRIGKFVGRHRIGVALAAVAVLALFAALASALVQAERAREQAIEARRAAAIALEQSNRAEAVRRILVGVFEQAAPDAHDGKPITARALLETGERQIDATIAAQPAVEADAATLIAELYVQIGVFDRATNLLQRALKATDNALVPDDVKARVLIGIAAVEDETNAYAEAIEHAQRGLGLLGANSPATARTRAKANYVIAHSLFSLDRFDEAEQLLRKTLAENIAALGPDSDAVADTLVQLGNVHARKFRLDDAEKAFRAAIAAFKASYGADSYHVAHVLNELSNMLSDKNDFAGAEQALRESLGIRMRTVGADHRDTMIVRHNLLNLMEMQGRIVEALPQRAELMQSAAKSAQLQPRDLGSYQLALGRDQRDVGQFDAAITSLRQSISAFSDSIGADSPSAISAQRSLGQTLLLAGRRSEAEVVLRHAVALQAAKTPADPIRTAAADADLAQFLLESDKVDDAMALLVPAADVFAQADRANHFVRPLILVSLSEAQLAKGDVAAAANSAQTALEVARQRLGSEHFQLANSLLALARAKLAAGDAAAAEPMLQEALRLRSGVQPPADPRVLEIEVERVIAYAALGRDADANALRARISAPVAALGAPRSIALQARLRLAGAI